MHLQGSIIQTYAAHSEVRLVMSFGAGETWQTASLDPGDSTL